MQIRELRLEDYPEVAALSRRNGLSTPDYPEWSRLWADNPFAEEFRDVPAGWVLEDRQGRLVGSFCNVPRMYGFAGRTIRSSSSMAWAVDPEHRPTGPMLLVREFFGQQNVDLFVNTTPSPAASQIFAAFKAEPLPHESYDRNLMWITRYLRFAGAAMRRRSGRGARLLQFPVACGLMAQDLLRCLGSRRHHRQDDQTHLERLDRFDARFDAFWTELCERGEPRLRASRDARSLAWHFGPALDREEAFILGAGSDDGLQGYLIARRKDRPDIGLRRYQVADLQVLPGCSRLVPRLITAAIRLARMEKAAAIELTGFEPAKYRLAAEVPHRVRRLDSWPFLYKCRTPELQEQLRSPDAWDPSPFDGDATL